MPNRAARFLFISISILFFLGASAPQIGQQVELDQFLNARSSASFTKDSNNLKIVLPKGTRGTVTELKRFESGNYGVRLKLDQNSDDVWVYYNPNKPSLKFESSTGVKRTQKEAPAVSDRATTIRETTARPEPSPEKSEDPMTQLIRKIDKSNNQVDKMIPSTPCDQCNIGIEGLDISARTNPTEPTATACNASNSYIEKDIKNLPEDSLMKKLLKAEPSGGLQIEDRVQISCIHTSMKSVGGDSYPICEDGISKRNRTKPCLSSDYLRLNARSFSFVSNCLMQNNYISKDELEIIYNMVNVESGFISNAVSETRAGGTGQLTKNAIADANRNDGEEIKRAFQNIPYDSPCSQLESDILKNKMPPNGGTCSRVSLDQGHPLKNLVYTFIAYRRNKDMLQGFIKRNKSYFSRLSLEDQARLTNLLAAWSHNAGIGGIQTPLAALIREEKNNPIQKNKLEEFFDKLSDFLGDQNYAHSQNQSPERLKETSDYFDKMNERAKELRKQAGVQRCTL
ncbi:MAG: hypothetical protein BroJett040_01470 [Oligoflexia bacterium]|nr:MAG: hypothetical protein BroJett040_01470 [Oligoflexia bacterium]